MNKAILTLLAALSIAGSARAQSPAEIPPGINAWWRAENNSQDALGGNTGTLQGGVGYAAGKTGQAFNFTGGSGQTVLVPASSSLDIGASAAGFALECWVNPANGTAYPLMEWSSGGGSGVHIWANLYDPGTVYFNWDSGGNTLLSAPNLIPAGAWHHVAVTYDKLSGMSRLYINAVEVATRNVGSVRALTTSSLTLGHRAGGASMQGKLDEVSLYSRPLSATEIVAIYNAGTAGKNTTKPYFTNPETLPDGGVGTPYSFQFAAAVTPGPHTFMLTGGTMPPGLDLHADGVLHGTPTAAAAASLTITATSSAGQTNTRTFSLNVAACLDPPPPGLVAWWRGQNDALDAAGGHQGLLMNNVSFTPGKVGEGFTFGLNGKLFVPHSPTLANQQFTLEAWARPDGPPPGLANDSFGSILIYKPGNGIEGLNILWRATDNRFTFYFGDSATERIISANSFPPGQFYHVAATYDGAVFRLHVNGVLEGQFALVKTISYNASEGWNIGNCSASCISFGYERRWVGVIDEVSIYNRALSSAEITAIHSAGSGGKWGALHITTLSPLFAGQGASYSQAPALAGGTAPYTFSLLNGTLPAGLSLSAAGVISGTPTGFGTSEFTVRVTDAETRPAERHYFLKVNARPVLGTIANQTLNEETLLTVPNPATDADVADMLTYELLDPPAGAVIDAAGTITWTPTEAQGPGPFAITTQVTDNGTPPLSTTNSFTVTVNEVNLAPSLAAQANHTMDELTLLTVPNPGTDPDLPANNLTYTLTEAPAGAAIDAAGTITWTPAENQGPGVFTFTTRVDDNGVPNLNATNTFTVSVNEVNTTPALDIQANRTMDELTLLTVNNGGTDADLPANNLTYTLTEAPAGAAIDAAGSITWTPTEAQGPGVFTFTTRVDDNGAPNLSATNTFTVTVSEVNLAPSLAAQANRTVDELTLLTVPNPGTDPDFPANNLTYTLTEAPAGAVISADGTIMWTPTEAQGPGVHTFTTRVDDNGAPNLSATNTFTVTVNEVNAAPALPAQADRTMDELTLLTVTDTASDADLPANGLTYELLTAPAGTTISAAGVITWTPTEAQGPGTHPFTVRVTDNGTPPLSDTHSFTVTVNEVNTAPTLSPQAGSTIDELTTLTVNNPAADADLPVNALTYELLDPPPGASIDAAGTISWTPTEAQGPGPFTLTTKVTDNGTPPLSAQNSFTVTVNEVNTAPTLPAQADRTVDELTLLTVNNAGTDADLPANGLTYALTEAPPGAVISAAGVITWTPTEAQGPGVFTFTTRVDDNGTPNLSATNTFTVTVHEVNTAPMLPAAVDFTTDELTPFTVDDGATDADLPANGLTYQLLAAPAGAAISAAGVITWTPTEAQGPGSHPFTVRVTDDGTPPLNATHSFTVTVNEVNTAPILPAALDYAIDELTLLTVNDGATDADLPANTLSYELVTAPAGAAISAAGVITWTPTEAQGPGSHSFTVRVTDNGTPPLHAAHSFNVTVSEVNLAPSLPAQVDRTLDELTLLTVLNPGTDPDLPANGLTYTLAEALAGAAIGADGTITWTPTEAQGPGVFTFTTRVDDKAAPNLSATNTFTVTVNEVNTAPVLPAQAGRDMDELTLLTVSNAATDADAPAHALTYELVDPPAGAVIDAAGTITWTPAESQGPGTFILTTKVTDNGTPPLSNNNSFSVTVGEVNTAPVLSPIAGRTTGPGQTVSLTASTSDSDLPANALTYSLINPPAGASIHAQSGLLQWRPGVALGGTVQTFTVRVTDSGSPPLSDTQSFDVTVNPLGEITLKSLGFGQEGLLLEINGPPGPDYILLRSEDMEEWSEVTRQTPATLPLPLHAPAAPGIGRRFYKVIAGP